MTEHFRYAGFWIRTAAAIIDTVLLMIIIYPILISIYGPEYVESEEIIAGSWDFIFSWVLPALATIVFWMYKSATPGKMAVKVKIVDAISGQAPSTGQLIGRYFAYWISFLPLCLGFLWIAWDKKKQGWHDKLSGTVVVRAVKEKAEQVVFEN